MAAPVAATRLTPSGTKLDDGFSTLVSISTDAIGGTDTNLNLWEKSVTPPGIEGGDAVDTTTMHNVEWRTFSPTVLQTLTEMTFTAAYDPAIYTEILTAINDRRVITVKFADGDTLAFFGYLKSFVPNESTEGEQPEASVTIVPTNVDSSNAEQAPVHASGSGTT